MTSFVVTVMTTIFSKLEIEKEIKKSQEPISATEETLLKGSFILLPLGFDHKQMRQLSHGKHTQERNPGGEFRGKDVFLVPE